MPTIAYDQQIFKLQQFGGISRYFSKLINGIKNSKGYHAIPGNYFSNNHHLNNQQAHWYSLVYRMRMFRGKVRVIKYLKEKQDEKFKNIIKKGKFDIFHPTYYNEDFLNYLQEDKPFVLTVHDMIHEVYHDRYFNTIHPETKQKSILIPKATHIIAVSENTKRDILSLYPQIDPLKISVIYHGYSPLEITGEVSKINQKYVLYVGNRWHYKNFGWMLEAISDFLKAENMLLVCAGGGDFTEVEKALINKNYLQSKVLFYNITSDTFLNELYRNAFCFIFPSLYEGFGLPILEAFANKCPVILTNASCFPEIAGRSALYFEANKTDTLIKQLISLLEEKNLRKDLTESARKRLKNFCWDKMVEQHRTVYSLAVNKKI